MSVFEPLGFMVMGIQILQVAGLIKFVILSIAHRNCRFVFRVFLSRDWAVNTMQQMSLELALIRPLRQT